MAKGAVLMEKGTCLTDVSSFLTYLNKTMLYTFGEPCRMYQTHLPKPEPRKAYPEMVIAWLDDDMNLLSYYGFSKPELVHEIGEACGTNCFIAELDAEPNYNRRALAEMLLSASDINLCGYTMYKKEE